MRLIASLSVSVKSTPLVCAPSRSVVSNRIEALAGGDHHQTPKYFSASATAAASSKYLRTM